MTHEEVLAKIFSLFDEVYKDTYITTNWISVKDRLPEMYIDVLAWVTDPDPAFNDYIAVAWVKDDDGGWDSDSFSEDAYGTVTHWMPLPEPPKEEENERND